MGTRKNRKSKKSKKGFRQKNRKTRTKKQKGGDAEQDNNLFEAIKNNKLAEVIDALDAGANVNAKDTRGSPALIWAIFKNTEIFETLLTKEGIDVNAEDDNGYTALEYAIDNEYTEIERMLLDAGAESRERNSDLTEETNNIDPPYTPRTPELEPGSHIDPPPLQRRRLFEPDSPVGPPPLQLFEPDSPQISLREIATLAAEAIPSSVTEENFIVNCIDKEVTYIDVINGEITINVKDYLQEDNDNIMFVYKSNKADTDLEYFGTTRTIITQQYNDVHNVFYGCNKVITPPPWVPKEKDYNKNDIYLGLSKIGLIGTSSEYCDIKTLLENEEHQLFAIKKLDKKYPSFVSKQMLEPDADASSASHCQGGDTAFVSTLIKAYPCQISDSNMLQETVANQRYFEHFSQQSPDPSMWRTTTDYPPNIWRTTTDYPSEPFQPLTMADLETPQQTAQIEQIQRDLPEPVLTEEQMLRNVQEIRTRIDPSSIVPVSSPTTSFVPTSPTGPPAADTEDATSNTPPPMRQGMGRLGGNNRTKKSKKNKKSKRKTKKSSKRKTRKARRK